MQNGLCADQARHQPRSMTTQRLPIVQRDARSDSDMQWVRLACIRRCGPSAQNLPQRHADEELNPFHVAISWPSRYQTGLCSPSDFLCAFFLYQRMGVDDIAAPRRHPCAEVGLRAASQRQPRPMFLRRAVQQALLTDAADRKAVWDVSEQLIKTVPVSLSWHCGGEAHFFPNRAA